MAGFFPSGSSGGSPTVKKNNVSVGTRQGINLIEGSNVTLTVSDDSPNGEVDVTIAASVAGGAGVDIKEEGGAATTVTSIDFVGSMTTASAVGALGTVTTAHGAQAGGTTHADVVAAGASGFMTGADKTKLDGLSVGITTQEEGGAAGSNQTTLNFVGAAVTAASVGATTTVTISTASARQVTARVADLVLTSSNTNTTYTNRGAAGQVILTLPAPSSGVYFRGAILAAQNLRFLATGGAVIWLGTSSSAANGFMRSNVIGSVIEIESDGTDWYVHGPTGTWYLDV